MARFTFAVVCHGAAHEGHVNIVTGSATDSSIIWVPAAAGLKSIRFGAHAERPFCILRLHRSRRGMALAAEIGFFSSRETARVEDACIFSNANSLKSNVLCTRPMADLAGVSQRSVNEIDAVCGNRRRTVTAKTIPDVGFAVMSAQSLFKRSRRIGLVVQIETAACGHKIDRCTVRNAIVPQQVSLKKIASADDGKYGFGDLAFAVVDGQARLTVTMQRI